MISKDKLLNYFFILVISLFLTFIPWDVVYKGDFIDRITYYNLIVYFENRIHYISYDNFFSYIKEEWLWSYLTLIWQEFFKLDAENLFYIISFLCIFSNLLILKLYKSLKYSIFFINPIFIDFFYSQLRLALAISFIFISYYLYENNKNKFLILLLIILSIFIHTTSLIFIASIYILIFTEKIYLKYLFAIIFPIIIGFLTGIYRSSFLGFIGDRRVEYADMTGEWYVLLFYFILFIILCSVFFLKKYKGNLNNIYFISLTGYSLCFFGYILGGYPSRFLVAMYAFILLGFNFLPKYIINYAFVSHFFYILVGLVLWIGI